MMQTSAAAPAAAGAVGPAGLRQSRRERLTLGNGQARRRKQSRQTQLQVFDCVTEKTVPSQDTKTGGECDCSHSESRKGGVSGGADADSEMLSYLKNLGAQKTNSKS